jgi:hypothetical protein
MADIGVNSHVEYSENGLFIRGIVRAISFKRVGANRFKLCDVELAGGRCVVRMYSELTKRPLQKGDFVRLRASAKVGMVLTGETDGGEVYVAWYRKTLVCDVEWIDSTLLIVGRIDLGAVYSNSRLPNETNMECMAIFARSADAKKGGTMMKKMYPVGIVPVDDDELLELYNAATAVVWACQPAQTRWDLEHSHLALPVMKGYDTIVPGHSAGVLNIVYTAAIENNSALHLRVKCPRCIGDAGQPAITNDCAPCAACATPRMLFHAE